ncbi:DNA-binding protein [Citrobacter braakii]|uniref:DNA-binding protein n=1 Tax=Citrobacter braakii TaxID=57706 RepID=UPI0024B2850C|nr:DNA-binding protein [Citrobacter braakii]WFX01695.1 hypothetical protein NFJ89_01550 [Citrobacter braakii]
MYLTIKELVGLPGMPGTIQGCHYALGKLKAQAPDLARRRSGSKALEFHIELLPNETQEVIRQRHYDELLEQVAKAEPVATSAPKATIKPRNKLALIRRTVITVAVASAPAQNLMSKSTA